MQLTERYIDFIKKNNLFTVKDRLLLAVSGGVDSVVLCELCRRAGLDFAIAHCNFTLRGADSDRDAQFVQELAGRYGVDFYHTGFDTAAIAKQEKKSVETVARELRYGWFEQLRLEHGFAFIATAHHADDNIETVLMNFFRGTGMKGLRGMQAVHGKVVRPLLFARRSELEAFLEANELAFVSDHTNFEDDYTRNYFRNQLIPGVQKVFPQVAANLLRNIERFAGAGLLYNEALALHKKQLLEHKGAEVHIPVLKVQQLPAVTTIVYEIISEYGFTAHQTDEVMALLQAETGKYVASATHRIIKNRKWLIIAPLETENAQTILVEQGSGSIAYPGGVLMVERTVENSGVEPGNNLAQLDAALIQFPLLLRKWKAGDYFYPLGMKKKKKLNRFLSDLKLSVTQKENTWVLEMDKKIIWVVGRRIDDRFKVTGKTKEILLITATSS
jgi:tRNA(Ile)-lysidine synthase